MPVPDNDNDPKGFDFNYIEIKSNSRVVKRIKRGAKDIHFEFDDGIILIAYPYTEDDGTPRIALLQGSAESLTPEYVESVKNIK